MNKILTIIIPTYNMEKYLRRCLDSLIIDEEGMKQLEVLVINDGSKDSSSQIAHEYQDKYPDTFRVIDKENGNYGSCINRGLKEATGKYVKVLDADDWFDIDAFKSFIYSINDIDADLILTDYNNVDGNGNLIDEYCYRKKGLSNGIICPIDCLTQSEPVFYGQMHGFTYRTSLVQNMGYHQTEGISYTDQEWVSMPFIKVKKFLYLDICLYQYLRGREGQTMAYRTNVFIGQLMKVVLRIADFIDNNQYAMSFSRYLQHQLYYQLNTIYVNGLVFQSFNQNLLREFDISLKKFPQSYKLCEEIRYKRQYIVKKWRKNNYLMTTTMKLLSLLCKETQLGGVMFK